MLDWLARFKGNLGVALSALGVLIAAVLGFLQCPQYWYILLLCLGSFILLLLAYPPLRNVRAPLPGQQIPDAICEGLLATAVRPNLYPLCRNFSTSRACGTAIAAAAALEVSTSARHLCDKLNVLAGDMFEEKIFTPGKLEEHLIAARRLRGILSGTTHSLSTECLRLFSQGESIYNDLCVLKQYLDERVLKPMEDFLKQSPQPPDPAPAIAMMLGNTVPRAIHRLLSPTNLRSVEHRAEEVLAGARKDWLNDLLALWQVDSCHPNALSPPTPPKRILNFIGSYSRI